MTKSKKNDMYEEKFHNESQINDALRARNFTKFRKYKSLLLAV